MANVGRICVAVAIVWAALGFITTRDPLVAVNLITLGFGALGLILLVLAKTATGPTRNQWYVLIAAFAGWMFTGFEMGLFPIAARPALQDLLQSRDDAVVGPWVGILTAVFMLGAAAGGLLFGWLGDKLGRVRTMALTIATYSIFTGVCYFAFAAWQLAVFRFLASLGMGGQWAIGVALVVEAWPEKLRPLLAGVIGAAANVGFLLIALLAMSVRVTPDSWQWFMGVGGAPVLLAVWVLLFVPESQRWKASVQAVTTHPLREVFSPPLLRPMLLAIAFASIAFIGTWGGISAFLPSWAGKLAPDNPFASGTTQALVSVGAILGCLIAPIIGGKVGRRPVYFGLCLVSLIVCQVLFREGWWDYGWKFLLLSGIAGLVTAAFYGWLPLYLPELFPTRVRATGQGLSFNSGRVFAAVGALTHGQMMRFFEGSYADASSAITMIYVLGLVLIWFAPETKGKPLPE